MLVALPVFTAGTHMYSRWSSLMAGKDMIVKSAGRDKKTEISDAAGYALREVARILGLDRQHGANPEPNDRSASKVTSLVRIVRRLIREGRLEAEYINGAYLVRGRTMNELLEGGESDGWAN